MVQNLATLVHFAGGSQLKQRLNDFNITENTNVKRKKELRLVKGEQRLRVEFLPLQLMNTQKNEKV